MKKNLQISTFDSYIIRKPQLPLNILFNNLKTIDLHELLISFLYDDQFLSSIFWSSATLYETILKYKKDVLSIEKKKKLLATLKKYLVRSATRCTPYGIFAGVSIQKFNNTNINKKPTIAAQIDYELISKLVKHIESDSDAKKLLRFRINPSVSRHNKKYRYLALVDNEYHLNSIQRTDFIDDIFDNIGEEFYLVDEIIKPLSKEFTYEELFEFIGELIEAEFLQSEISPLFYSENLVLIHNFLQKNRDHYGFHLYNEIVSGLLITISSVNNEQKTLPFEEIQLIKEKLTKIGINQDNLLQIDLLQNSQDVQLLNPSLLSQIKKTINFLYKTDLYSTENSQLSQFKKVFISRYDRSEQRLTDVLDPEIGIGFPAISGIGTHFNEDVLDRIIDSVPKEDHQNSWTHPKIIDIIEQDPLAKEIDLGMHFFDEPSNYLSLPPTFYVIGNTINDEAFFLQNIGGASAKTLFGRFTHLNEDIKHLYEDVSAFEKESSSDIIVSDIIFIPNSKISNVTRPQNTSEYEISIIGESLSKNHKINVNDLYISVRNNEVVLRSKSLNKRIIPRLSNAHNFSNTATSIYRFLSSIQHQGMTLLGLPIDQFKSKKRYIPGLRYHNIILHRATWMFFEEELSKLKSSQNPILDLEELFTKWKVPQYIALAKEDNELFIDRYNSSYLEMLLDEIKNAKSIKLVEWIFTSDLKVKEYANQIILPFKNDDYTQSSYSFDAFEKESPRIFFPGSQWIYYKFYCSSIFSDELLRNYLLPLLNSLLEKDLIIKGFFIRFTDPDYHIRFRVYASQSHLISEIMQMIFNVIDPLTDTNEIWKMELSTYEKEIERYGTSQMDDIEMCFTYDSLFISNLMSEDIFIEDSQFRLLLAVKNIDYWLSLFNLNSKEKINFCEKMEKLFEKEFSKKEKNSIYAEYRNLSPRLYEIMNYEPINYPFQERNTKLQSLNLRIENLSDLIHMCVNRWFPSEQRLYEYIIYIFAGKYFKRIAINS